MRRISQLVKDIRFNTNNIDSNRFNDLSLIKLFNDAQKQIQAIIFMEDTGAKQFVKEVTADLEYGVELYDLPSDIYSVNSVNSIARAVNEGSVNYYTTLRLLSEKERRKSFGYALQGSKYLISPYPRINLVDGVRINYVKKLPDLSPRIGRIKAFTSESFIKMESGFIEGDITEYNDYVSIVNKDGEIKHDTIYIDSYNSESGRINTSSAFADASVGDYIVIGKVATSHSELPENCEPLLTSFVERKIQAIDSSSDLNSADVYTEEEKNTIRSLFAKSEHDAKYPSIVDDTYLNE